MSEYLIYPLVWFVEFLGKSSKDVIPQICLSKEAQEYEFARSILIQRYNAEYLEARRAQDNLQATKISEDYHNKLLRLAQKHDLERISMERNSLVFRLN